MLGSPPARCQKATPKLATARDSGVNVDRKCRWPQCLDRVPNRASKGPQSPSSGGFKGPPRDASERGLLDTKAGPARPSRRRVFRGLATGLIA